MKTVGKTVLLNTDINFTKQVYNNMFCACQKHLEKFQVYSSVGIKTYI